MPYSNEIITLVNNTIRDSSLTDKRFSGAKLEGIACQVSRQAEGETVETLPAIISDNQVERYVGVDDSFPLQLYHRILGNSYGGAEKKQQYGDDISLKTCATEVVMVVFAKRSAMKMPGEQLEMLIASGFPDIFTREQIATMAAMAAVKVTLRSSDMDSFRVWGNEYKNIAFPLGPEDILFSMNYRIDSSYQKGCFKICDPCDNG